ncbi:MAG: biotin-dependent carboxyltransferase family protein, partial [Acidobacteria bacterium]|nr:biotin-dependent carboxyltransferase family protein [Acidobacteriota bacterium]
MSVRVVRPGAFTTVQDLGRFGHRASGVPPAGAMDPRAARAANRLVGNPEDLAVLELTLSGPELVFARDSWIAITGASARGAFCLPAGEPLAVGRLSGGPRAWLAVDGGFDVPLVLGSRSTSPRGGFGGFEGRALRAGDVLPLGRASRPPGSAPAFLLERPVTLRVLAGAQAPLFSDSARTLFLESAWRVSPASDRCGLRLEGPALPSAAGGELLSEGVLPGAVQVPAGGSPILLGPDGPVTGGYPKIAQVIAVDVP